MTVPEVADYLNVTRQAIYQWRHKGGGPRSIKVGQRVRFRRSDVDAWLAAHTDDGQPTEAAS